MWTDMIINNVVCGNDQEVTAIQPTGWEKSVAKTICCLTDFHVATHMANFTLSGNQCLLTAR